VVSSPPMSGWTSPASSVSSNWLKRFVRGSVKCSRCHSGRLVRQGVCHSWGVCRGVRTDALRGPPCILPSPGLRGLGGLRGLRESGRGEFCGQPGRWCPCLSSFQLLLVRLGALGEVAECLILDKAAIAHVIMVIRRSVAESRGVDGSHRCLSLQTSHLLGCLVEPLCLEICLSFSKCGLYGGDSLCLELVVKTWEVN